MALENQYLQNPEYSEEAGSHVMDIYLEVHEHHRQLGMLWEKRKTRLKEYLHLCMFDQDSSQVRLDFILTTCMSVELGARQALSNSLRASGAPCWTRASVFVVQQASNVCCFFRIINFIKECVFKADSF